MGSARVTNAKPIPMETTDKKTIKTFFKSIFNKKKEKPKIEKKEPIEIQKPEPQNEKLVQKPTTVATILEKFDKLNLQEPTKIPQNEEEEDESENFTVNVIEEPRNERNERIHSHSSEDSGFSDTKEDGDSSDKFDSDKIENDGNDDLAEELDKLALDEENKTKKKYQTVVVARGPTKTKLCSYSASIRPYPTQEDSFRQISQINTKTLTGGQVIVNACQTQDNFAEIDLALKSVEKQSQVLQNDRDTYLEDVLEYIHEDTNKRVQKSALPEFEPTDFNYEKKVPQSTYLNEYAEKPIMHNEIMQLLQQNGQVSDTVSNEIDEFMQNNLIEKELNHLFTYVEKELSTSLSNDGYLSTNYTYPTPPRSDTVPSPISASPGSFYPSNSEYTLPISPERSPIYNSDYEKYQEIPHFEEEKEATDKKARERTISVSSMTMKQFKDMQKEIEYNFSKRECCQLSRKSCKDLFKEHLLKLSIEERKHLCMEIAKLDLKKAYGVLHHILLSMSTSNDKEDLQTSLFGLVCDRILAQEPALFVGDAGLSLLKASSLRCPHKPLLTRYVVQCIRSAINTNPSLVANQEFVFTEVDALGDNLIIACARAGDRWSDVLSEIVRRHHHQPPLFKHAHTNADGYTALHVACSQHSAAQSRLHTVHVLLSHAGLDITQGDLKGRDTALHLAVNSPHCDLQLILLIFKQVDRKEWKGLAHWPNLSSKTPIDLARLATKTPTRQNYPSEVMEFLKKCR